MFLKALSSFVIALSFISTFSQILPNERNYNWNSFGLNDTTTTNFNPIELSNYGLYSNGIISNDSLLSRVIDIFSSAGAAGVILNFPSGIFLFNQSINLPGNIVLRGRGADSTTLKFNLNGSGHAIKVFGLPSNDTTSIIQNIYKDSNSIIVNDPSLFIPDDWIRIIQDDSDLINNSWALNTVGQIVKINQVINNRILLNSNIRMDYKINAKPYIKKILMKQNVGLECLKLVREDISTDQVSNIKFSRASNCWVSGIESDKCNFAHIDAEYSSNLSISKSYFHDAHNYGSGGKAYGIMLNFTTNECLVEDNIFNHLRHSMILQAGANGNIFSYNFSKDPYWTGVFFVPSNSSGEMVLHGNWPYANLFEGNDVENIVVDNSHASNGPNNTFFRNRARGYGVFFSDTESPGQHFIANEITNASLPPPYNNFIFNVLGNNHILYGNNILGNIDSLGSDSISIASYFYTSLPDFIPFDQWGSIGFPNLVSSSSIPSKDRFNYNSIFSNSCGQNFTNDNFHEYKPVKVFPNPFNNNLNIVGENIESVTVFDLYGRQIYSSSKIFKIDNIEWKNGIYIVNIKLQSSLKSFKLIKY